MSVANSSRSTAQAIMALVEGVVNCSVLPPRSITLSGGTDFIYDIRPDNDPFRLSDGSGYANDPRGVVRLDIINLDNAAVKICLVGKASTNEYHYVLKAATAFEAGDGGSISLPGSYRYITAFGTAGKKLSIVPHFTR